MERFARDVYGRALLVAIEWRYVTIAAAIGVLVLSVGLFASGRLRYQFLPAVEGDVVYATLTMPPGSPTMSARGSWLGKRYWRVGRPC